MSANKDKDRLDKLPISDLLKLKKAEKKEEWENFNKEKQKFNEIKARMESLVDF